MKVLMFHSTGLNEGQIRDEVHIAEAFQELGHTVWSNDEKKIIETDLILLFKSNDYGVDHIKKWKEISKVPIFFWIFDNSKRFEWIYPIAKEVSLFFAEELGRAAWFKEQKIPFYYFPYHAAPEKYFYPIEGKEKIYEIIYTGFPYDNDVHDKFPILLVVQEQFNLHVWGNNPNGWQNRGFKNVHGTAFDEKLSEVIAQSKICLAISNSRVEGYWSIRQSQIMQCRGFCLARYTPGMEKESRDGVVYWDNKDDLLESIRYYLDHTEERLKIEERGKDI